ncbi:fasciclin domain-containing protein [Foetidibacter luteolus]|uniref:fasciclin domain-containing protein n=1 Tax=Foetidibacter luteolus TaxID=2608880 RepID=UPI00129B2A7B|nr:fasciclin domain-containing protein [Foetidibacter luteolus]
MKRTLISLLSASMLLTTFSGCSDDDDVVNPQNNITDIVASSPDFSILKSALDKAGLTATVNSSNNITVFAPDNTAFSNSGITQAAIDAMDQDELAAILTYHVIAAKVASSAVPASDTVKTLQGLNLYASNNANGVFVNGIKVKQADVQASNGTVHVIDKVLLPPSQTIAQIASGADFTLLLAAVVKAGLATAVSGPGKFTVFAPTNTAFNNAGFNSVADINSADQATIEAVVKYHVLATNAFASDLSNGGTATSLQGGTLTLNATPPTVKITGSNENASAITTADVVATNGVVHVIDKVLLP